MRFNFRWEYSAAPKKQQSRRTQERIERSEEAAKSQQPRRRAPPTYWHTFRYPTDQTRCDAGLGMYPSYHEVLNVCSVCVWLCVATTLTTLRYARTSQVHKHTRRHTYTRDEEEDENKEEMDVIPSWAKVHQTSTRVFGLLIRYQLQYSTNLFFLDIRWKDLKKKNLKI